MSDAPIRCFAMVRDGVAFDWLAVAPVLEMTQMVGGKGLQPTMSYPIPPVGEGVDLVVIERGFDPQSESVDVATGGIVPNLALAVAAAHARIDAEYEARLTMPGPVKSAEYAAKVAEARVLMGGGQSGPMLLAEAAGGDVVTLAEAVISRADEAAETLAKVAAARREAKQRVSEAANLCDCRAVVDEFIDFLVSKGE